MRRTPRSASILSGRCSLTALRATPELGHQRLRRSAPHGYYEGSRGGVAGVATAGDRRRSFGCIRLGMSLAEPVRGRSHLALPPGTRTPGRSTLSGQRARARRPGTSHLEPLCCASRPPGPGGMSKAAGPTSTARLLTQPSWGRRSAASPPPEARGPRPCRLHTEAWRFVGKENRVSSTRGPRPGSRSQCLRGHRGEGDLPA